MAKKIVDVKGYSELISIAQVDRPAGVPSNYVRVDLWGKEFGEDWRFTRYREQIETKRYWKSVSERERAKMGQLVYAPGRGGKTGTWVHPLIASHYASWLSADFALLVNQTFLQVLDGDSDLAAEMMLRDHNKERVERAKKRLLVADTNRQVAALASKHGLNPGVLHNDRYRGLYRRTAKQLRIEAGIGEKETPLDVLSTRDNTMNSLANQMAIEADNPDLAYDFANDIRDAYQKRMGKVLTPIFEAKRLRPSQAQRIAYAPEYQMEMPLIS
jgi:hypothetical protein